MTDLLFHPATDYQLRSLAHVKPHAVLLSGKLGAGKKTAALKVASEVLGVEDASSYPYFLLIEPKSSSIGIDRIREVRNFLRRKTTGKTTIRRVVIAVDAQSMTSDAQNAFLKTLEEPPEDTMIILTTHDETALKPTIRSRSQHVQVLPVSLEQATTYFSNQNHTPKKIQASYFLSGGEVGLMAALLNGEEEHPLVEAINTAKELVTTDKYSRLTRVDELSKQKEHIEYLLQGMQRVANSGLQQAASRSNIARTKQFYVLSQAIMDAQKHFKQNVSTKLLLTNLFLRM